MVDCTIIYLCDVEPTPEIEPLKPYFNTGFLEFNFCAKWILKLVVLYTHMFSETNPGPSGGAGVQCDPRPWERGHNYAKAKSFE